MRYVDEFTFRLNDGNVQRHTLERLDSFVAVWILHSCYAVFCAWWKEGKAEVIVEEMEHTDPIVVQAHKVNPWRRL